MPSRIRFTSARSVFDAFPDLSYVAARPANDIDPLAHARALSASSRPNDAILFISHLLPRREAVWWAAQCVRTLTAEADADEALLAAESWVRTPEDDNRRAALLIASDSDRRKPATWLAFAAGWSGGSILPADQKPVPPPAGACAMAANSAIMLAIAAGDPRAVVDRIAACAEAGVRFADGGEPTVSRLGAAPR
ncbi:MAG TPA: hypothetical protein VIZ19_12230 [Roseiarcus sp.]|jgi:hypothetical protein